MRQWTLVATVSVASIVTTGCNQLAKLRRGTQDAGSPAPTVLSAPPTPQIRESDITFRETKARVSFFLRGTILEVSFFDFLPSSKVTVGSTTLTTSESGYAVAKVDLTDRIARLSPKDAFTPAFKLDPQTKVSLDFGPQAKLSVDLPPISVSFGLAEAFRKLPGTPVTIGSGPKPGTHSVLYMAPVTPEVVGPAKTMADIDWIAVLEAQRARDGKRCTGYRKSGSAESVDHAFVVQLVDEKVSVYEVRTGKPIAQKVFAAPNECPSAAIGTPKNYASADEEKRWLRQRATGGG